MQQKWFQWFGILVFLLLISLGFTFGIVKYRQTKRPTTTECAGLKLDQCPAPACVVCPPCPECSSLSCQTADFCAAMDIDATWYQTIKKSVQ